MIIRLRPVMLSVAIATSVASLLIIIHGIVHNDLRPTVLSNAVFVGTASSWLTAAILSLRRHIASRLDAQRIARQVATQDAPARPERLHLVPTLPEQPGRARRFTNTAAPALLLTTLAVLVTVGLVAPRATGGPAVPQLPATQPSTITVTVTPAGQATPTRVATPASRHATTTPPATSTVRPTSSTQPPDTAPATTTAPKKTRTPTLPVSTTTPPAPTSDPVVATTEQATEQAGPNAGADGGNTGTSTTKNHHPYTTQEWR